MKFLFPEFLYALSAIAIPIIIHLFNFRKYKRIYYSDISLLKEIKIDTKSKARVKHLLLLLSRILAIVFLVLAFAQPYVPIDNQIIKSGNKVVSIYIDNSFSTDAKGENGYLFQDEKEKALSIIEGYESIDRFHLATNDFKGHLQRIYSKEEIRNLINDVELSPVTRNLSEIVLRQKDILNGAESFNKQAYLLSDFQQSISDFSKLKSDTGISTRIIPFERVNQSNFYIDSIWFKTPHRQNSVEETIFARIYNLSEKETEVRLELDINDKSQGFNNYNIPSYGYEDCEFNYTTYGTGIKEGCFKLADYPEPEITFDDYFYFSYNVAEKINILVLSNVLSDTTTGIGAILGSVPMFNLEFSKTTSINYAELSSKNLIVLQNIPIITSGLIGELTKFVGNGGNVLILPATDADISSYNTLLGAMEIGSITKKDTTTVNVKEINLAHPMFSSIFEKIPTNIDLPVAQSHFKINIPSKSKFSYLMRLQNGDPYLTEHIFQSGKIYLSAVATNQTFGNFLKHATVIAAMIRIGEFSYENQQLYGTIGKTNSISLKNKDLRPENVTIKGTDIAFIPQISVSRGITTLLFHDQLTTAGNYQLLNKNNHEYSFGWNYNRNESDTRVFSAEEIQLALNKADLNQQFELVQTDAINVNSSISNLSDGEKYWKWCIILVLLSLALEILIYRLVK
ncbi:BatA domain-containing protein [Flavobacteriales bacterium]|nr:BatA domain-containing protein [Flavobacteriales bacterium]